MRMSRRTFSFDQCSFIDNVYLFGGIISVSFPFSLNTFLTQSVYIPTTGSTILQSEREKERKRKSENNITDKMTSMKLSASSQCVKYLMFIFNLFFVMTGIVLLSLGLTIHAIYFNYVHFLDNKFLSIPSLMIAVGIIIFFIAFFGCCGAVRENYCMLIIFTTLLIFIFILEFSGGIAGYVLRSQAGEVIKEKMTNTMQLYNKSNEIAGFWDEIQTEFECCGVTNMTDWEIRFDNSDLPMSCCRPQQGKIGTSVCNITVNYVYPDGCLNKFQQYIKSHAVQLGGVGLGIATIQVIGIWFSIYLARSIRNSYESV